MRGDRFQVVVTVINLTAHTRKDLTSDAEGKPRTSAFLLDGDVMSALRCGEHVDGEADRHGIPETKQVMDYIDGALDIAMDNLCDSHGGSHGDDCGSDDGPPEPEDPGPTHAEIERLRRERDEAESAVSRYEGWTIQEAKIERLLDALREAIPFVEVLHADNTRAWVEHARAILARIDAGPAGR